jgi:hypothetical protein
MSYIFITEPYISSYADIDVLLAIWRSGALHYYTSAVLLGDLATTHRGYSNYLMRNGLMR